MASFLLRPINPPDQVTSGVGAGGIIRRDGAAVAGADANPTVSAGGVQSKVGGVADEVEASPAASAGGAQLKRGGTAWTPGVQLETDGNAWMLSSVLVANRRMACASSVRMVLKSRVRLVVCLLMQPTRRKSKGCSSWPWLDSSLDMLLEAIFYAYCHEQQM